MLVPAFLPIVWDLWTGNPFPSWMNWLASGFVLVLWMLALAWPALRPLRGYMLALLALAAGNAMKVELVESAAYTTWAQTAR